MSTRGVVPACRTLDCVSVFAHSIGDAKRVFDVARAFDAQDAYSRPWAGEGRADWDGAAPRIGVPAAQELVDHVYGGLMEYCAGQAV